MVETGGILYPSAYDTSLVERGWKVVYLDDTAVRFHADPLTDETIEDIARYEDDCLDGVKYLSLDDFMTPADDGDDEGTEAQHDEATGPGVPALQSRGCGCSHSKGRCICCGRSLRERFSVLRVRNQEAEQADAVWLSEGINILTIESSHESNQLAWLHSSG